MLFPLFLCSCVALAGCSEVLSSSSESPPPRPYVFSYTAGRYPGHADREHTEVSDGSGVVRGHFAYLDPRQKLRSVDYVADRHGFHPVLSDAPPPLPADSEAVARARDRHLRLYARIAEDHQQHPHPIEVPVPRQTEAVAAAALKHSELFRVIAEQHARIAAEREALQREEETQRREEEAQRRVEETQRREEEAQLRVKETQRREEEAQLRVEETQRREEEAQRRVEETQRREEEDAHRLQELQEIEH